MAKIPLSTPFSGAADEPYYYIKGLVMNDGLDDSYLELRGAKAKNCPELKEGQWYGVEWHVELREYTDRNQQQRYANNLVVDRIREIGNPCFHLGKEESHGEQ